MLPVLSFMFVTCVADGAALGQHYSNGLNIFTDGSKIEGKVGAALSI